MTRYTRSCQINHPRKEHTTAHDIEVAANGDAAFFAAWHRLGTTTTEAQTAEQALEIAHLSGWDGRKAPLTAQY